MYDGGAGSRRLDRGRAAGARRGCGHGGAGARDGLAEVVFVEFDAQAVDAEPGARDHRRPEPEERVGHHGARTGAVQPQAYSGSFGGKVAGCGRSFSRLWMVS